MRKVQRRSAALSALVVAATGFVIAGVAAGAQAGCEKSREIGINDVTAAEGSPSDGTPVTWFVFTVTSAGCAEPGSLEYSVKPVTTDEKDLRYVEGRLVFDKDDMAGQRIAVAVLADDQDEPWETFEVLLHTPSGELSFCKDFAIATIADDDGDAEGGPIVLPSMLPRCELHKSR